MKKELEKRTAVCPACKVQREFYNSQFCYVGNSALYECLKCGQRVAEFYFELDKFQESLGRTISPAPKIKGGSHS